VEQLVAVGGEIVVASPVWSRDGGGLLVAGSAAL
jgi:hypothetical protein